MKKSSHCLGNAKTLVEMFKDNAMVELFKDDAIKAVAKAVSKHPHFSDSSLETTAILAEEVGEYAQAACDQDNARQREEILDVLAVCYRELNRLDAMHP